MYYYASKLTAAALSGGGSFAGGGGGGGAGGGGAVCRCHEARKEQQQQQSPKRGQQQAPQPARHHSRPSRVNTPTLGPTTSENVVVEHPRPNHYHRHRTKHKVRSYFPPRANPLRYLGVPRLWDTCDPGPVSRDTCRCAMCAATGTLSGVNGVCGWARVACNV